MQALFDPVSYTTMSLRPVSYTTMSLRPVSYTTMSLRPVSYTTMSLRPVSYTTMSLRPVSLVKLEKSEMSSRATMAGPELSRFGRLEFFPYPISTRLSSKIRPIARQKEFCSLQ